MVCKKCMVHAGVTFGLTMMLALVGYLFSYFRLARNVQAKHSADLTAEHQQALTAIQTASDQRLAQSDPHADYLRRKQAFDAKYGTH